MARTAHGFGTLYYDWQHADDGTATATLWVVALFLPVIPLKRHGLRIVTDPDEEETIDNRQILGMFAVLGGGGGAETQYEVLAELPLDWKRVLRTYLRAYVLLPLALFAPLAGAVALIKTVGGDIQREHGEEWFAFFAGTLICAWMGYFLIVVTTIFHRARGGRK